MHKRYTNIKKRIVALLIVMLMNISILPSTWSTAIADDYECDIPEHTHSGDCCELICELPEDACFGTHTHSEACYAKNKVCGHTDETEHAEECFVSELICPLEESETALLSGHIHTENCYNLICMQTVHIHSEECIAADISESDDASDDELSDVSNAAGELSEDNDINMLAEPESEPTPVASQLNVSGIWDYGAQSQNENILFGSDAVATIEHDNILESETVAVRISAFFPDGTTDKKLSITLAEGLNWFINGAANIPESTLLSVSELQNQSTVYGQKLSNGTYIYNFADGAESVDVEIMVKKTIETNYETINDAIVAEISCTQDGTVMNKSASLKTLKPEQTDVVNVANNKISAYAKPDETVFIVGSPTVINTYTSGSGKSHKRLYDYAEITLEAPSNITLVSGANSHPGNSVSTTSISGWKLKSQETVGDITTYVFRVEKLYASAVGITPEWNIPYEYYAADDRVVVKTKSIEWKLYGDDDVHSRAGSGTLTYIVVDPNKRNEIVISSSYTHNLQQRADSPDAVYQLTGWALRNDGTDPSAPKVIEFEFDTENIGVTGLAALVPKGNKITTVWYKLKGDTEWTEKAVNLSTTSSFGNVLVSNVGLGLNEDDYFAAFKYELDFLHDNGTPADPSDDFRYGLLPGLYSAGKSGVYVPIAGVNLGLNSSNKNAVSYVRVYDKVEEGGTVSADTGKVALKTVYSTTAYNYMQVDVPTTKEASAGTTIHLSANMSVYWRGSTGYAYCVGFTHYPIIYIRDETGEGISNVQLKNNDGVDILSKYSDYVSVVYSHTETEDTNNDGKYAKVYKIDTRPLSLLPAKEDRYAAAVGFFDESGEHHKLNISYTITPASSYNDGQLVHYMTEAIFLADDSITSASNRNTAMSFTDPYDVNQDGKTTGTGILQPTTAHVKNYYLIFSRADISVSASIKKDTESEYTSWDGSDAYFQMEPNTEYDVNFGILNGAGIPTSSDPDKITYVYIPIPKEGDEWGEANSGIESDGSKISEFAFTTKLKAAVNNPNSSVFSIDYANVDLRSFDEDTTISTVGTFLRSSSVRWGEYSENANCIRIAISGMPASEAAEEFILAVSADGTSVSKGETNILNAIYFEDVTDDQGRRYTGWFMSDGVSMQIAWGEVSGRIWNDRNGNGIQDDGEAGIDGAAVILTNADSGKSFTGSTDSNGCYSFTQLPLGSYKVSTAYDSSKFELTAQNAGSSDYIDSDAAKNADSAEISGIVIPFSDAMGKQSYDHSHADFGFVPYVDIEYSWTGDIPDGQTLPSNERLLSGVQYTAETVAHVTGYTFKGWFTDSALSEKFINGTQILSDLSLYGNWSINRYSITYNAVGEIPANAVLPTADTVNYNTVYNAEIPTGISGYTFDGWYTDSGCSVRYNDATAIKSDVDLYGRWVRNTIDISGTKKWVENGTGFERPDSITVNLYRNGDLYDSCSISKDESVSEQSYSFADVYECDENGVPYNYTVSEERVPDGYVADVSGYDITNTYNVDKFVIKMEWVHTGNPNSEPASVDVELECDDALYQKLTLNDANGWEQTVTVPRVSSQGHSFSVNDITVDGYITAYDAPVEVDTDNDGEADVVTYVIRNTFDMPKIGVSGSVAWDKIPAGMQSPDITIDLMLDGNVVDTVTVPSGTAEYAFSELDRYAADGSVLGYTVKVRDVPNYETTYTDAVADAEGNIVIDIANEGVFVYGSLYVSNKVFGSDAPADAEFVYTVTFDSEVEYPYTGSYTGTVKSGDKITLKNDESISISEILVGVPFTVEQSPAENFVTIPADGKITGVISSSMAIAEFTNNFQLPPTGNLEISNKVTGNAADKKLEFVFKVEFDHSGSYECRIIGSENGDTGEAFSVVSGAEIKLSHGETAVIYNLPVGIAYTVTEIDSKGYTMTSTGTTGTIIEGTAKAAFINARNSIVAGDSSEVPKTGDDNVSVIAATYIMQFAMIAMLLCMIGIKRGSRSCKDTD